VEPTGVVTAPYVAGAPMGGDGSAVTRGLSDTYAAHDHMDPAKRRRPFECGPSAAT